VAKLIQSAGLAVQGRKYLVLGNRTYWTTRRDTTKDCTVQSSSSTVSALIPEWSSCHPRTR